MEKTCIFKHNFYGERMNFSVGYDWRQKRSLEVHGIPSWTFTFQCISMFFLDIVISTIHDQAIISHFWAPLVLYCQECPMMWVSYPWYFCKLSYNAQWLHYIGFVHTTCGGPISSMHILWLFHNFDDYSKDIYKCFSNELLDLYICFINIYKY